MKIYLFTLFVLCGFVALPVHAQDRDMTIGEKIAASSLNWGEQLKLKLAVLKDSNMIRIRDALIAGIKFGKQAKEDEANGYVFAHQKAAYDWGYEIGDPDLVSLIRIYWESVQLGVFAIGDYHEKSGAASPQWQKLESMVGGNGKDYEVNREYIDDIFNDVQIAKHGAERSYDRFESYAIDNLN